MIFTLIPLSILFGLFIAGIIGYIEIKLDEQKLKNYHRKGKL